MAQRVDQAFVLRTQELGESDLILTLLAESSGRVRGVARSARKSRKRFGGSLEPLTRVKVRWFERDGRELHRIESMETERSYAPLQSDPVLQAACAVMAEISATISREEQPEPRAFRLLGAVLDALEAGIDPRVGIRYFEYWTLRLHGLLPDLASCGRCGRPLSARSGRTVRIGLGVLCGECVSQHGGGGTRLRGDDLEFLSRAASRPPGEMADPGHACRAGGALEELLRGTLESFVEKGFRTYRHLSLLTNDRVTGSARS